MVQYKHESGMPFLPHYGGGKCLPQVYCRDLNQVKGDILFTDDAIWDVSTPTLFRLVVLLPSSENLPSAMNATANLEAIFADHGLRVGITIIIEDVAVSAADIIKLERASSVNIYRVATADEFAQSPLCESRPRPEGYDPYRLGKDVDHKRFLFLRPDRFIFAACDTIDEVKDATGHVAAFLNDSAPGIVSSA